MTERIAAGLTAAVSGLLVGYMLLPDGWRMYSVTVSGGDPVDLTTLAAIPTVAGLVALAVVGVTAAVAHIGGSTAVPASCGILGVAISAFAAVARCGEFELYLNGIPSIGFVRARPNRTAEWNREPSQRRRPRRGDHAVPGVSAAGRMA